MVKDQSFLRTVITSSIFPSDHPNLHVFPYSERPGTAALSIPYVVDDREKKHRAHKLLKLSDEKTRAFYAAHIGQEANVLFEKAARGKAMHGFTDNYIRVELSPAQAKEEYDNQILRVRLGEFNFDQSSLKSRPLMKVAIVILNWNGRSMMEQYLPSVLNFSRDEAEIINC